MDKPLKRNCLPCTACCNGWLNNEVHGHKISAGHPCPHSTTSGCGIYPTRPKKPCQEYMCSWLVLDEILPDWMRPDLSGAIVHLSVIWHGHVIMSAVPVGRAIPAPALEWLKNYAREHKRPFIYFEHNVVNGVFRGMRRFGFGPEQFRRDVIAMAEKELSSGLSMRLVQS